jgi:hypothetical protein
MNAIPLKLRNELAADPEYRVCARAEEGDCMTFGNNRITWEHALLYAGKQIQRRFAIIPLCWWHHIGAGLNKIWNKKYAMSRATQQDKKDFPRLWR